MSLILGLMRTARATLAAAALLSATAAAGQNDRPPAATDRHEAARLVEQGNRLLNENRPAEALAAYEEAARLLPDSPEVAYNRGLAHYRLGRFDEAERAFQDALRADRPELEARARYNLGRAVHAAAEAAIGQGELPQAANELQRALRYYQDALQIAPQDADAARNKELAGRLLAHLRRLMEEKKEKQEDQPSSQPESRPSSQPQPASQPSSQPSSQPQAGEPDGEMEKQEGEPSPADRGEDQREEAADAVREDPNDRSGGEQREVRKLSPEEAEKILQQARDAERQRREACKREAQRVGRIKVDKDW